MKRMVRYIMACLMAGLGLYAAYWQHTASDTAALQDAAASAQLPAGAKLRSATAASRSNLPARVQRLEQQLTALTATLAATEAELARLAGHANAADPSGAQVIAAPSVSSTKEALGPQHTAFSEQVAAEEMAAAQAPEPFQSRTLEHGLQSIDSAWSQELSHELDAGLANFALGAGAVQIIDSDCRETLCRLRLNSNNTQVQEVLPLLLASTGVQGIELQHRNEGGELITEALLIR